MIVQPATASGVGRPTIGQAEKRSGYQCYILTAVAAGNHEPSIDVLCPFGDMELVSSLLLFSCLVLLRHPLCYFRVWCCCATCLLPCDEAGTQAGRQALVMQPRQQTCRMCKGPTKCRHASI
ncbi:unnamed protein product, partial [Ectocarpus sp. 4 AP-2014]